MSANRTTIQKNASLGLLLATVAVLCQGLAVAEGPSWWPASSKDEDAAAETPKTDDSTMVDSPLFKMGWPKIEMPKFAWKPGLGGNADGAPTGGGNPISRTLDKVADGSKRAADNVRGMWDSTMSKLPFAGGDGRQATQTAQKEGGGFWSRLLAPPEQPQGSETVQGFLAQERVGTVR